MKMMKLSLLFSALLMIAACSSAPDSDEAKVGDAQIENSPDADAKVYQADLSASIVEWIGTKTTGRHPGYVNLQSGELSILNSEVVGGEFVMDMSTITVTDQHMADEYIMKLTGHLKSPDFFEVDRFPTSTFVITNVVRNETQVEDDQEDTHEIDQYRVTNPTHEITGNLTIKGVTKGITFPARIDMNDSEVKAMAKFNINRKDWDLRYEITGDAILNNTIHFGIGLTVPMM